ncbi:MAG: iron-sulfur cluster assembly scaffold protein [Pseudomonadota bacterium]|nr:iron-sulfur cluster assembly scaffold protein [Pseudomonadota bacterium]
MAAPLYTRDILRLAASLGEPAVLERVDGEIERRSVTCGSRISVQVEMADGRVAAMSQRVEACAFGQAAAALMIASAPGRSAGEVRAALGAIARWLGGEDDAVTAWPGLALLDPARSRVGRHGAILLPFEALLGAIEAVGKAVGEAVGEAGQ